ncbi:fibronectin type III domain-containing protein [Flavobacterium sedimenticola]|uniref:Fibronectin type III domain-containing protein n=1 Tax=Flavobacterium sedimenticola TaxID=3043286 RepID=A0ABT6XLG3_9FLAO|nr:fibronectin type III domain-containing protein [Flavobacterium sedimenticola]MDI9255927.1 fibronectin type III domain-containing protein [Flavobacterium sedimenticola]
MKKITLLILLLFFSFSGYSQLSEGFESTTGPDGLPSTNWTLGSGNWAVFDNGVGINQRWGINATVANPPIVYQGTNAAYVNRENIGQNNTSEDYLATPLITIPANGQLRFFTRMFTTGNQGTIYQIKWAPSTGSQTSPAAYTNLVQQWTEADLTAVFNIYEEKVVDISALAGQQGYLAFVKVYTQPGTTLDGDRWLIDNVNIIQKCLEPTNLTFSAVLSNGATLNWANPSGATSWEIEVVPAAGTPTGVGAVYSGPLPYVVTGLNPNTAYTFYVRALCSNGFASDWVGPSATFTTSAAPPVCGGNFVDSGNTAGNYANNENITTTICPTVPGELVTVTFTSFNTEANWDGLYVYNGNTVTPSALLPSANPAGNVPGGLAGSYWGNLTGANLPGPFTSTTADGCLTFVFRSDGSGVRAGWVANVTCAPPPACQQPSSLTTTALTSNSVTLGWTSNGAATSWEVLALPCGSPAPNDTTTGWIPTTVNPYVFTGLNPATCYDLYVRGNCTSTSNGLSLWTGPRTVTTQVAPPQCGGNFADSGGAGANYANGENITTTICPTIPGEKVTVTFTFFNTEANWDGLYVYNGNAVNPAQLLPSANGAGNVPGGLAGSYWGNLTGANLPGPFTSTSADGCMTFVFRSDGSVNNPGWLANITCAPPPACQQPVTLTATNMTTTTVQLGWVSPGTATSWEVIALPAGSPAPNASTTGWTPAPTNPFVLGGLTPGTAYEYYVRGNCGVDGVSLWSGPVAFSTVPTCPPPTTVTTSNVLSTSVQLNWNTVNPSTSWQIIAQPCGSPAPTAASTGWIDAPTNPFVITGLTPNTCYDFYVRGVCTPTDISFWSPVASTTTQVAPPVCGGTFTDPGGPTGNYANGTDSTVTICPNPGQVVTVTFTSFNTESNFDGLYVFDGNSIASPQIASTNGAGFVPGGLAGSFWGNLTGANLPGPFTSTSNDGCLTFRFRSDGSVNNPGWIANVTCGPAPNCQKPTNLTVTNVTTTSALLGWTEPSTSVTQWEIIVVPQGSPVPLPTDTGTLVTTNPTLFTGLTPGTQYTFYVRGICPTSGTSAWSTGFNFSTLIINDECSGAIFVPVNSDAVCQQIASGTLTGATPSVAPPIAAPCVGTPDDDVWFQFIATNSYLNASIQSVVGSTTNLNFAVYSGQCGTLTQVFCSTAGSLSGVLNGLTVGSTYYIRVYSNAGTPQTVNFNLCISTPSTCANSSSICSQQGLNYGNTTGVTSLGQIGCLFTSPNPTFFTIQVVSSGPINYLLTQSTTPNGPPNLDVDYAAWGPFNSQAEVCAAIAGGQAPLTGLTTGCSYSAAPTENFNIANAVAGQFYVILITNFSNQPGYITLTQTNANTTGSGQTLCCPDADFAYSSPTYCIDPSVANPIPTIPQGSVSGVFSLLPGTPTGLVFANTTTGEIDLQASAPGNYVVLNSVAATVTCPAKEYTFTISLVTPSTATIQYSAPAYCQSDTAVYNVTQSGTTGGTYSVSPSAGLYIDVNTGAISPSLSSPGNYTIMYSLPGSSVCMGANPTAQVEIQAIPNITQPASVQVCNSYALPALTVGNYYDAPGGTGNQLNAGDLITTNQQIYIYAVSPLGCSNEKSFTVTINTAPSPTVNVTQPTCATPTGTVEVTSPLSSGAGLPSNLFISEVTDANSGALTYIEIFNGTGASVDLSNYKLRTFNNGSSTVTTSCDNALSGILNNNSTFVVAVGSATNLGGVVPNLVFASCTGVNTDDNIRLSTTANVDIDIWGRIDGVAFTPSSQPGYTYRRNNTAVVPSTTWNAADWTAIDPEDYTNVGTYALPSGSIYEYSIDNGSFQSGTIFSGLTSGDHTIIVRDVVTGCLSLPFTVTIDPIGGQTTTTFNPITICNGDAVTLPAASIEGVTGTWVPSTVDNTQTATYVFIPDPSFCAAVASLTVTVNQKIPATFNAITICNGDAVSLPSTSLEGYAGTWSPSTVDNTQTAVYTFTPNAGQCADVGTLTITVNQPIQATFDPVAAICEGDVLAALPTTSLNGYNGTWSPALNNTATTTYTFTPTAGQCASAATLTITVNPKITPTFNAIAPLCNGATTVPSLPTTSTNGITGTWSPSTIDVTATGVYTFNPDAGQCANSTTMTVTVLSPIQISTSGNCEGVSFVVTASPVEGSFDPAQATYLWEDSTGATIGTTQSVVVTEADTYTVTVTYNGCSSTANIEVDAITCVIQKGISANNDGLNDSFDLNGFNVKNLSIFNRYGMKVYSKGNYINEWKGQSDSGDELPDGTYYYVIEREGGETKTGWIYINRAQ